MSRYPVFDRRRVQLRPIAERGHDLLVNDILPLAAPVRPYAGHSFSELVTAIRDARRQSRPVILMLGGHPIKLGLSRYLIDLMERGFVTHVAMNGAGLIHDFELATVGGTSESVTKWIAAGQFGLWQETSLLNDLIAIAASRNEGLGECVGRELAERRTRHSPKWCATISRKLRHEQRPPRFRQPPAKCLRLTPHRDGRRQHPPPLPQHPCTRCGFITAWGTPPTLPD